LLEIVSGSVLGGGCSDESPKIESFTYRLILGCEGSRDWALAKSRYRSEDLELIPCQEVVWPGQLRFGLRWDRSRSWSRFLLDDEFLVDEGTLVASCRRWVDVDGGLMTDG